MGSTGKHQIYSSWNGANKFNKYAVLIFELSIQKYNKLDSEFFCFFSLMWYVSLYVVIFNFNLVMISNAFGVCSWYKYVKKYDHEWKWIFLTLVYVWYTKKLVYITLYGFFAILLACSISEAMRNDYFWLLYSRYMAWWYMYNDLFMLWNYKPNFNEKSRNFCGSFIGFYVTAQKSK